MKPFETTKRREFLIKGTLGAFFPLTMPFTNLSNQSKRIKAGRRIVTGNNNMGKSIIKSDGVVPDYARWSDEKSGNGSDLWVEPQVPVDLNKYNDLNGRTGETEPPDGGIIIRVGTWEPGFSYPMHKTATLDFVFIISGNLELNLDEGSTIAAPGDTIIQRGTNHAWRVVGNEPCTFAAVLLSGIKNH